FALMNLSDEATKRRSDEGKLSLADEWIISRFNRTVASCDEALRDYRFDQYAKSCYDFFWGELCDWYLEAIKPALRDPKRAGQTVEPKRAITVSMSGPFAAQVNANRELSELLAMCQLKEAGPSLAAPAKAARTTAAGMEIFVEAMADEAAEQQRQVKQCDELK